MQSTSREQAIIDQMASNFAVAIAQLEAEKAILQVDNQLLKQQLEQQGKRSDD